MMKDTFAQRFITVNGIQMHFAEAGLGPLVILLHGFPETSYSWRHQLAPLAEAGYHVVAPDLRGYGQTDRPEALEAYDIFQVTGDIIGLASLANAFDSQQAVIVGHDWGALIASYISLFRPDLFCAAELLSVPYVPGGKSVRANGSRKPIPGRCSTRQRSDHQ
jgi:pimeloyl-ACP methyl ester carboxylesterase